MYGIKLGKEKPSQLLFHWISEILLQELILGLFEISDVYIVSSDF